jgi:hypothetical protein
MSAARRKARVELLREALEHGLHVPDRAVAEERHGAVRDAAMCLDLRPPHAAMTDADPIDVEGLGDDDVIDARRREPAPLGEIMNAAVAARLLVDGARDLERAGQRLAAVDESLHRDDGGGDAALHVAGAAAEHLSVPHDSRKRVDRPARARLHHVDVAVEVHARPGTAALAARDYIDPRIALAVARRSFGTHIIQHEPAPLEPLADELRARPVSLARRVHRGIAHERTSELHQLLAPGVYGAAEGFLLPRVGSGRGIRAHDAADPRW